MFGALILLSLQGVLGAFDNIWNHEWRVGLPSLPGASRELALHAIRGMIYAPVFLSFGWLAWNGVYGWIFAAILAAELVITMADFIEEDRARKLSPLERVTHAILTLNYGAFLALAAPSLLQALSAPTGVALVDRGGFGWLMAVYALGSFGFGLREAIAATRMKSADAAAQTIAPAPSGRSVLITGGSGFIGRAVTKRLAERGDRVIVLSRDPERARRKLDSAVEVVGALDEIAEDVPLQGVVNLAGAPIFGKPWTKTRKRDLAASRIGTTRDLVDWLLARKHRPEALVSASAIGWYGASGDERLGETAPVGQDFPAALCSAWEREAMRAAAAGIRVCRLRLGLVLGRDGGMLKGLLPSYRAGLGSVIGSGRQWVSWIHIEDAVEMIARALQDPLFAGLFNATAPHPVRQAEFAKTLGHILHRPVWPRIPAWPLRAGLGEMASLLTEGQRAEPVRALDIGFAFRCHEIEPALRDLLPHRHQPAGRGAMRLHGNLLS
jgi:hypothetical protein